MSKEMEAPILLFFQIRCFIMIMSEYWQYNSHLFYTKSCEMLLSIPAVCQIMYMPFITRMFYSGQTFSSTLSILVNPSVGTAFSKTCVPLSLQKWPFAKIFTPAMWGCL